MAIFIIYFIIGLFASILGSMAGIGGGVIIKPILDTIGLDDVSTISVLSASTVFAMAAMSLITMLFSKKLQVRFKIASLLAIASSIGGIIGKGMFNRLLESFAQPDMLAMMQSIILAFLMILIYIYQKKKYVWRTFTLEKAPFILMIGFTLGLIAAFLGIGGGPFNVAILSLCFSMTAKESSINSLFIIFFSQLSSIITTSVTTGFTELDLTMLPYIVIGGVVGGLTGSALLSRVTNTMIDRVFTTVIFIIICINLFNAIKLLPSLV
ncbi:sulfite exporter TauE/SafE family protein [Pseudogracilibacillus sp. SO10305]|uniref:sulfite exporter TauE/SafE family protein n=1 Tax=Pseudogracilibacillus sp. SO10305 TaxID=3098292 RepID=UPI00300E21CB